MREGTSVRDVSEKSNNFLPNCPTRVLIGLGRKEPGGALPLLIHHIHL
jgi:hypothetical protein